MPMNYAFIQREDTRVGFFQVPGPCLNSEAVTRIRPDGINASIRTLEPPNLSRVILSDGESH